MIFFGQGTPPTCADVCNGTRTALGIGGAGSPTYNWNNGAGTNSSFSNLCAGTNTLRITDANGCANIQTFTITFAIGVGSSFPIGISVAPNPFATNFTVGLSGLGNEAAQLSLIDLQGRVLWSQANVSQTSVNVALDVAAGVYFLQVQVGGERKSTMLMRQ